MLLFFLTACPLAIFNTYKRTLCVCFCNYDSFLSSILLVFFLTIHSCRFSHSLCFLSVILFHLKAHGFKACIIKCFVSYCWHVHTCSHLPFFLYVLSFHFLALFLRAYNIACFLSYFLNPCTYSNLLCFLWVILYHFIAHFLRASNITRFLSVNCILALFKFNFPSLCNLVLFHESLG